MTINLLQSFINQHDYDIRKTQNGRWIDQKCALDVVCFVADCIVDYIQSGGSEPFQSPDIWHQQYSMENVQAIFGKPDPNIRSTLDEYNKFFRQPMKMLAAAGVLNEDGYVGQTIQFSIANWDVLKYIALRERNSYEFLCMYIEKTLYDSGLKDNFASFFDLQSPEEFYSLKNAYIDFCLQYTPINTAVEASRIFSKVLNPLACKYHLRGSHRGRLSLNMITFDQLMYNRANWRDVALGKNKNIARSDFHRDSDSTSDAYTRYLVNRAMKNLREYNDIYRASTSEIVDRFSVGELATHMHHIFPKNEYPELAEYIENIIALTSGQHLQKAHPNGNTFIVDKEYQYTCLIAKTENIRKNLINGQREPTIYNFEDFMFVLDTGFNTDYFENLPSGDFKSVITGITMNY